MLVAMGYGGGEADMAERLGKSGDGGIDGVINEDALGLDAVYIQAFFGSLTGESATKGVFVTTSDFSREAKEYIDRVQQRLVLINGQRLALLMIQFGVGVRTRQSIAIQSDDKDYFSDV